MSQSSTSQDGSIESELSEDGIYSRIKIENINQNDSLPITEQTLQENFSEITSIEFVEIIGDTAFYIVTASPTDIDTDSLRQLAVEETGESQVEVWVRRMFPDEIKKVQTGECRIR